MHRSLLVCFRLSTPYYCFLLFNTLFPFIPPSRSHFKLTPSPKRLNAYCDINCSNFQRILIRNREVDRFEVKCYIIIFLECRQPNPNLVEVMKICSWKFYLGSTFSLYFFVNTVFLQESWLSSCFFYRPLNLDSLT